jgi:hypothetical protein
MESSLKSIFNLQKTISTCFSPPEMNLQEQRNLRLNFLTKLLEFLKEVSIHKCKRSQLKIFFEEIPETKLVATCILPYTRVNFRIKVNLNYRDST